ncbi:hypothetical protein N7481_000256 [Penicillium waksmanii]|uniref:uncharacterized protein n=1 Tax=Penicillium waksmanii TaxID=69791 RepID=UPI002548CFD6|nr:uncharacterized protein N7481_000256 [Penicillium waksmanii]KAJ5999847.1 hypothetical protein N7481_000256 [Penicillium waksmanii]
MSTLEEVLATRHSLSEYHVYHESEYNVHITPFLDKTKEFGHDSNRQSDSEEAGDHEDSHRRSDESNSYFLHQPKLLFHNPPRVLRRGSHRDGEPICLLYSAPFWSHWNVQFQDNLPDILDPRGMVPFENRSSLDNTTKGDDCALTGYKVRTWRVWGESGKAYHNRVNARRKMKRDEGLDEVAIHEPKFADEAMQLKLSSPFLKPRRYEFQYAGIHFSWEGTRDLPVEDKLAKLLLPLSHLKLVAQVPGRKSYIICLFSSTINRDKYGRLWIFDNMISKVLEESGSSSFRDRNQISEEAASQSEPDIRRTRLYELVMATSMCMIMGEWEKRMTVYLMILLLIIAGRSAVI